MAYLPSSFLLMHRYKRRRRKVRKRKKKARRKKEERKKKGRRKEEDNKKLNTVFIIPTGPKATITALSSPLCSLRIDIIHASYLEYLYHTTITGMQIRERRRRRKGESKEGRR